MDSAPIHTSKIIDEMIKERDYKCIYLPHYSPELNLIEQFWSVVKGSVERGLYLKRILLPQMIADASNKVTQSSFEGFVRYSNRRFDDCLAGHPT